MKSAPLLTVAAVALVCVVLALPVKQSCGAPARKCATTLDRDGNLRYYYEIEPLGVVIIEHLLGSNISIYYTSGVEGVKVR